MITNEQEIRNNFKGKIDVGVIDFVGDVFIVRPQFDVREFHITLNDMDGLINSSICMQLTRERVNLLSRSDVGKKVEVWYFINGIVDSKGRKHNVLNCTKLIIL